MTAEHDREFALRELIVCWDQAYEALTQGNLDRVANLLDVADEHVAKVGDLATLPPNLCNEAVSARGRLQHGMRAGLEGLSEELARARKGEKVLRGYGQAQRAAARDPGVLT